MNQVFKAAKKVVKSEMFVDEVSGIKYSGIPVAHMTALADAIKAVPKRTILPLSRLQIKEKSYKNGVLSFFVEFELEELMVDVDTRNECVSSWLTGGDDSCLEDISYRMMQVQKNGSLLMEITGNVSNWLQDKP